MDQAELVKIADLLWERKQIILYGPPGTGKTYLARELARHLTDDGAVKLVQFHPSYTYEDFFEGFRPEPGGSGTLTFTLRAGPFRDFAEVAGGQPHHGLHPDHRRDQPREPGQGVRRAVLPAGVPRRVDQPAVLPGQGVHAPAEPVPHRHDEHRRPVDRADRHGHAPPVRVRRTGPAHPARAGPAQPLARRASPSAGSGAAAR